MAAFIRKCDCVVLQNKFVTGHTFSVCEELQSCKQLLCCNLGKISLIVCIVCHGANAIERIKTSKIVQCSAGTEKEANDALLASANWNITWRQVKSNSAVFGKGLNE